MVRTLKNGIIGILVFVVSATSALKYISIEGIGTKGTEFELIEFSFKFFLNIPVDVSQ